MSGRLADVEARIGTVHKLAAVISAMRGIAASRAQEARHHTDSIRAFADTIGRAIGQALAAMPDAGPPPRADSRRGQTAVILLAAEQGFAGAFSARVFDAAAPLIGNPHELFLVGDRGQLTASERGLTVSWSVPMIAHPSEAAALATRITGAIYDRLTEAHLHSVAVVHATPGTENEIVTKWLVPFDYSRFAVPAHGPAPLLTLPPDVLLARLAEEYVFSELAEAVMLSFAAENEARMRAMIAAQDNVSGSLEELIAQSRRLRQEEITDEIVELATGSLPAR